MPRGRRNCMKGVRRICRNTTCRKEFEPGHELATYCCPGCRGNAYNQRFRVRIIKEERERAVKEVVNQIQQKADDRVRRLLGELGMEIGGLGWLDVIDYPVIAMSDIHV